MKVIVCKHGHDWRCCAPCLLAALATLIKLAEASKARARVGVVHNRGRNTSVPLRRLPGTAALTRRWRG